MISAIVSPWSPHKQHLTEEIKLYTYFPQHLKSQFLSDQSERTIYPRIIVPTHVILTSLLFSISGYVLQLLRPADPEIYTLSSQAEEENTKIIPLSSNGLLWRSKRLYSRRCLCPFGGLVNTISTGFPGRIGQTPFKVDQFAEKFGSGHHFMGGMGSFNGN